MSIRTRVQNSVEAYLANDDSPDISNPIHSTEFAAQFGFAGALVGGVTVWGWATDTILEALGESWLENGWAEFSFRQPTFPGDRLLIDARRQENSDENVWTVTFINQQNVTCVTGKVGLGQADWYSDFERPSLDNIVEPVKIPLILENADIGGDWTPMQVEFNSDLAMDIASLKQHADNSIFYGPDAIAHPAWTAGWAEQLLRHNFLVPSSMHTKSRVQHLQKIKVGSTVTGGARLINAYEQKAHHFANFDVLLQDEAMNDIAQLRHWTIFKIATPEERENAGVAPPASS